MVKALDDQTAGVDIIAAIRATFPDWTLEELQPLRTVEGTLCDTVLTLTLARGRERQQLVFKSAGASPDSHALTAARREIRLLSTWRACGLPVPRLHAHSWHHGWRVLEHLPCPTAWHHLARPMHPSASSRAQRAATLTAIGETLARFHLAGQRVSRADVEIEERPADDLLARTLDKHAWVTRRLGRAATAPLAGKIAHLHDRPPPVTASVLCHGDLSGHNMLIAPTGRVILIDWSEAFFGPPACDLAYLTSALNGLCDGAEDTRLVLQGYRSHAPVDPEAFDYHVVLDDVSQTLNDLSRGAQRAQDAPDVQGQQQHQGA